MAHEFSIRCWQWRSLITTEQGVPGKYNELLQLVTVDSATNLRTSPFIEDLLNDVTFSQIRLAGQSFLIL